MLFNPQEREHEKQMREEERVRKNTQKTFNSTD